MVGKEHNARLSQPARWHRVWQLHSPSSRCAWQWPPQGPAGHPEVPSVWAASAAPARLSRRRCWACCPPRGWAAFFPVPARGGHFSAPAAGVVPVSEGRLQAASALLVPCSASAPGGPRVAVPGCGSAPPSGAGGRWLVREQLCSHTKCLAGGVSLSREQRGAGRKAEAGRAHVGEAVVRLQRGSPAAPGSHCRQVCPLPGTLLGLLAACPPLPVLTFPSRCCREDPDIAVHDFVVSSPFFFETGSK